VEPPRSGFQRTEAHAPTGDVNVAGTARRQELTPLADRSDDGGRRLVDQATGAVLDRDLVGTLDLVEREADGRLVVVDLKTAARKYTDLQVEASLQLSIYSYATAMNGLADEQDLRLRFDVLTKTKTPELHRY
jgi:RecB family exonuclease